MIDGTNFWWDTSLYDKCCGNPPRVQEEYVSRGMIRGFVSAFCDSCGSSVEFRLPMDVITEWNQMMRTGAGKKPT